LCGLYAIDYDPPRGSINAGVLHPIIFPIPKEHSMPIDVDELSPRELESLINKAKRRKTALAKRKPIATVRAKLRAQAKAEGYTIEELFGGTAATRKTATRKAAKKSTAGRKLGKVPPKYRNPANKDETWAGRGKQPRWMAEEIAKGKTPEDFLIK